MPADQLLLVGSYTQPEAHVPTGCGEGILTLALNLVTGQIERRSVCGQTLNPSYLALDAVNRSVFAVSENISGNGEVHQFRLNANGKLSPVVKQSSHGAATCHVATLPHNRVCVTSYLDSCLDVYPVRDGELLPANHTFRYEGRGANSHRQKSSHVHQAVVAPEENWFYVCDLGADCVWRHDIAAEKPPVRCSVPPGHGPRHLAFHPKLRRVYVLGETTGAVLVCDWVAQTGALKVNDMTCTLDDDAAAAAIRVHPSQRTLWVSIRKMRSLLAFRLDELGRPSEAARVVPTSGEPRDFAISPDGRWLVGACQSANELVVVELDPASGLPTRRTPGRFVVRTPVSVLFL